jgi:hypothetical protein
MSASFLFHDASSSLFQIAGDRSPDYGGSIEARCEVWLLFTHLLHQKVHSIQ